MITKDDGRTIQFHANTTYENFVGGLGPKNLVRRSGISVCPAEGLPDPAPRKRRAPPSGKYLLHVDEINRADLSKVLGEAIYLLEPDELEGRAIDLPYKFEPPSGDRLSLPDNLHILGP